MWRKGMSIKMKKILTMDVPIFSKNEISYIKNILKKIGKQRDIGAWFGTNTSKSISFQIINGHAIEPATTEDNYTIFKKSLMGQTYYHISGKLEQYFGIKKINIKSKKFDDSENLKELDLLFKQLRNTNL